ncbi:MAG: ATP-dependent zinc metalloprotease FtsH [Lachnospiraceae bacterium]|nr:ATP-dependent zinc metalloprotease FtsH [Lachnospiraceae bacterium]
MQRQSRGWLIYVLFLILIVGVFSYYSRSSSSITNISNSEYETMLESGSVKEAVVHQNTEVPTGYVSYMTAEGGAFSVYVTDVNEEITRLKENNISYKVTNVPNKDMVWNIILPIAFFAVMIFVLLFFLRRNSSANSANQQMMNFGKSSARMSSAEDQKTRFTDVAGLDEEKEELEEIVDFLRDPEKYTRLGARIPKGVLLVGSPGTGKTLIAKAVAGEAGVPFFSISGSDFVEMFVGVGASRVRDLFSSAKKNHPCIVFIDEIDAVARKRGSGMGGGHDEREQTLNQLLVEMDGFGTNEGIIVLAATNRPDILDPAIRRPGRFDRTITVGTPDVKAREEILKVHAKDKPLGDDVDLKQIAQTTAGFAGADLENLLNEAAIRAASDNRSFITQEDIKASFLKIGVGKEKKSKVMSEKEKRITAYHESGHAILFHVLPNMDPVYTISIVPTGMGAAGYTMPLPETDNVFQTRNMMLERIVVGLGGRVAEEMRFDDITTGASQDIKQCTAIARAMVTRFGMSETVGLIAYDDQEEVFIGRDWGHTRNYSDKTASVIDEEVTRIVKECHQIARSLIAKYQDVLDESARQLIQKERLSREEFERIFADLHGTDVSEPISIS